MLVVSDTTGIRTFWITPALAADALSTLQALGVEPDMEAPFVAQIVKMGARVQSQMRALMLDTDADTFRPDT